MIPKRTLRLAFLPIGFLIAISSDTSAFAQTAVTAGEAGVQRVFADNYFGVGFSASFCSGVGLTLKDHFAYTPLSLQITGMPFKDGDFQMYDLGGELQYDLYLAETRLYLVAGAGYYYYSDGPSTGYNQNRYGLAQTTASTTTMNQLNDPFRLGFGLGYEIPYGRNVGMMLNLMFTAFTPSGDIIPTPSIGFVGYFR